MVPGEACAEHSERSNRDRKIMLSVQESAEAIVLGNREGPNQCKPE